MYNDKGLYWSNDGSTELWNNIIYMYELGDIRDMKDIQYFICELQQVQAPQNGGMKNEEKEKQRRQKQGRRLQEINARRREEKVWLFFLWHDSKNRSETTTCHSSFLSNYWQYGSFVLIKVLQ